MLRLGLRTQIGVRPAVGLDGWNGSVGAVREREVRFVRLRIHGSVSQHFVQAFQMPGSPCERG